MAACADRVIDLCTREGVDPLTHVALLLGKWSLQYIDSSSLDAIRTIAAGGDAVMNSTVELFVRKLKKEI